MQLWTSSHGAVGKPLARSGECGSEAGLRLSRQDPRVCDGSSRELETETRCQNAEAWGHLGAGLPQASVPSLPSPALSSLPSTSPRKGVPGKRVRLPPVSRPLCARPQGGSLLIWLRWVN